MTESDDLAFEEFIARRATKIKLIASHTRGEYSVSEVQSEAWILAHELAGLGSITAFLTHPENEDKLLSYLY